MNILQLVPKLEIGGVEKSAVEVSRYLTLNGHKAVVVSGGGRLEKDLAAIGARHYVLPVGRKNIFTMLYCYFKLKQVIKKENIELVHGRSRVPALIGYFAARSTGRTFITTAHGQYRKHLMSRVMGWGKTVIVANETMARHMKDNFDVPLRKMTIIPRGVDTKKFSFLSPEDKPRKTFRIGMICRFTPIKGHLDFLKAASFVSRKMPNLEIVLMGDRKSAKEDYIKKIDLTIRRLMIDKVVKFVDTDKDVAEVMGSLDVLVSANKGQEAFGRTIIEAQARGVPVVATKIGGVVENIQDKVTGFLCEPGDHSEMADKIMLCAKDRALAGQVAANARAFVEKNYSLEKVMDLKLKAYERILQEKNILIFKISSLGDIILSTPSIRAVRDKFPGANIKVLVDVHFREVLDGCPYVNELITCDFENRDRRLGLLRLARRLRSEDFDISIDLQNNRKSHLLAYMGRVTERYGYDNRKLSFLLNRRISPPKEKMDPVSHQSHVLGLLGITKVERRLELWPGDDSREWVEKFLEENWLKRDQKLVALSLSASKRWKTKNWGVPAMVELAETLASSQGIRVVLLGTDEDRQEADKFIKKTVAKPINAVGKTSIQRLISLINRCDALVAGDSSPMHIAAATETPFVAIFGPTDPERHLPPAENFKLLYKKLKCAPCYRPTCLRRIKCLTAIKPEEVFNALTEVMA